VTVWLPRSFGIQPRWPVVLVQRNARKCHQYCPRRTIFPISVDYYDRLMSTLGSLHRRLLHLEGRAVQRSFTRLATTSALSRAKTIYVFMASAIVIVENLTDAFMVMAPNSVSLFGSLPPPPLLPAEPLQRVDHAKDYGAFASVSCGII
jgi:hypothetical protein